MELMHIELGQLSVSKANMRHGRKAPDIADILPSVRARGVLVPLLVRPSGEDRQYEIVAGRRRYHAALVAAEGRDDAPAVPCAILADGDDADALEASLIENHLRADPDEVTLWETFTKLIREGRNIDDVAATFAMTANVVRRILALGNLLPPIREAYRAEEIEVATVRHLTLASKAKQKQWLALFKDEDSHEPRGYHLKAWLFGGASIATSLALFPLETYEGEIVTDLFEEQGYFADTDQFWQAQHAEIAKRQDAYLTEGWQAVEIVPAERYFESWQYDRTPKHKGGKVYIDVARDGSVSFHEGLLSRRELKGSGHGDGSEASVERPARPEVTGAMNDYLDLHRHGAVAAVLADNHALALRTMVAHAICGSPLWSVKAAERHSRNETVTASVEASLASEHLAMRRTAMLNLLGFASEEATVVQGHDRLGGIVGVLRRLIALRDEEVLAILAMAMAETLSPGSELIELLGQHLAIDMADWWSADPAFLSLIRDREVLNHVMIDVAGEAVASAHTDAKAATKKQVIADCLAGENGRERRERFVPPWLAFPPSAYSTRGGIGTVAAHVRMQYRIEDCEPQCEEWREAAE